MKGDHPASKGDDPDPFVIGSLVLVAIGVLAQVTSLAIQVADRPPRRPLGGLVIRRTLADNIDEARRVTERIVQFLSYNGDAGQVLGAHFRSGEARLFLNRDAIGEYQTLITRLVHSIDGISHWTLELLTQDEEFARSLGVAVADQIGSIASRVNDMLKPDATFQFLFDESLFVLRTLSDVLARLRGTGNLLL